MKVFFHGKILTIPNILTFLRICMIPWFMWTYLVKHDLIATGLILLLSYITDCVDGDIARRFNMISNLGKALDPLADKLTQLAMLACLLKQFPHMWLVLIVMCIKELFALVTCLMAIRRTGEVQSSEWHGKQTTDILCWTLIAHALFPNIPALLSDALVLFCTGMIVLSGVLYVKKNLKLASGQEQGLSQKGQEQELPQE